ncbi:LysR family transcriptional regulator [Paenibacillus alkalitolerans]|uniref:LysR family transcriptional regulator n=1 Tax=Paenibacillus alkalitolerans TaxID=2799335 RepID=UPI0018F6CEB4|nr:LysR family transcriptional regulator [Paenibacillus alkalitolerans]
MELRHLITFKTIVDAGGFKKAAEELGYAQSSITAHIKELETELGYPLFDRMGKSITLTEAGRRFLPYAVDIINLYSKSKEVLDDNDEPSGPLTIGATESVMIYWLPNVIMDFMNQYPKVELTLKPLDYPHISEQLKKGDIDIAMLVELSSWSPKELTIYSLKNEQLSLVQTAKTSNISETMLYTEKSCSYRSVFEEYLKMEGRTSVTKVELPSIEAIKKCVLCGLGKSFLPCFTIKDEVERGELVELPSNAENYPISIFVSVHKNKWRSTTVDAFLNLIMGSKNQYCSQ